MLYGVLTEIITAFDRVEWRNGIHVAFIMGSFMMKTPYEALLFNDLPAKRIALNYNGRN